MRRVRVSIDRPLIPAGQNIKHIATSYQLSRTFRMDENPKMLLAQNMMDTYNLLDWFTTVDIRDRETVYARAKYHFNVNGAIVESYWSRVIPVDGRSSGLKLNSNVILTPTLSMELQDDLVHIKTSQFDVYSGPGTQKSTSWYINDSDNISIFKRENDEDNLNDITVNNPFEFGKMYSLEAKHINTYNVESNYGKKLYLNGGGELMLFEFDAPEEFIANRKFYYRLRIWTTMFESYDLEIRQDDGKVVKEIKNNTKLVDNILLDDLILYMNYHIFVRLTLTNGTTTYFKEVFSSILLENQIIPSRPNLPYPNKYVKENDVLTSGIACVTTRELFDKKVITTDFKDNSLYLLKEYDNKLQIIKELYTFEGALDVDYINIFQLPNHDIIVDVTLYDEKRQIGSYFYIFDYDPIKLELTLIKKIYRDDERYSTSICNSMVVMDDNTVYWIPAYKTNGTMSYNDTDERFPLVLRKLDMNTYEYVDIALPHKIKYNGSLFRDMNNNLYTVGGSFKNEFNNDDGTNIEWWKNEQKDIFKFNNGDWEKVTTLPDSIPDEVYCLQAHLRLDGKVAMFNASHSGPGLTYNDVIIFNPDDNSISIEKTNLDANVPIRNNIVFISGDIRRITSKTLDPQQVFTYFSDTTTYSDKPELDDVITDTNDLVVNDGEVVNIEDIYKYTSITINGSGIVYWYRPQGITKLDSKTLIIFRSTTMTQQEFANLGYESVLILDGSILKIKADKNFADLPKYPPNWVETDIKSNIINEMKFNLQGKISKNALVKQETLSLEYLLSLEQDNSGGGVKRKKFKCVYRYYFVKDNDSWSHLYFYDIVDKYTKWLETFHVASKKNVFTTSHYRGSIISGYSYSHWNNSTVLLPINYTDPNRIGLVTLYEI